MIYKHMFEDLQPAIDGTSHLFEDVGEINYEVKVTHDPALIHQFRLLRQRLYGVDDRFVGFRIFNSIGAEDYDDPNHIMILLTNGNRCYGGACFTFSTPTQPVILDLENDIMPDPGKYYFSLRERLPELELDRYAYAECSRLALHPSLRSKEATRKILRVILDVAIERRVRYLFCIGDRIRTRFYKQVFAQMGLDGQYSQNVHIPMRPEYEGVQMVLQYGDTKCFHMSEQNPEADCLLNPVSHTPEFY